MDTTPGTEEEFLLVLSSVDSQLRSRYYEYALDIINKNLHRYEGNQKAELLFWRGVYYNMERNVQSAMADYKAAHELDKNNMDYLISYVEALVTLKMFDIAHPISEHALNNLTLSTREREVMETALK